MFHNWSIFSILWFYYTILGLLLTINWYFYFLLFLQYWFYGHKNCITNTGQGRRGIQSQRETNNKIGSFLISLILRAFEVLSASLERFWSFLECWILFRMLQLPFLDLYQDRRQHGAEQMFGDNRETSGQIGRAGLFE